MKTLYNCDDDDPHELTIHRNSVMLVLYFVAVIYFILNIAEFPDRLQDRESELSASSASILEEKPGSNLPVLVISRGGIITLGDLTFPESREGSEALVAELHKLAPFSSVTNPLRIEPDAEVRHERVVGVLSMVLRSGLKDHRLQ